MPEAVEALGLLGIQEATILELKGYRFKCASLYGEGSDPWKIGLGLKGGFVIRRALLDQQLREIAAKSCRIQFSASVYEIEVQTQGVSVAVRGEPSRSFAGAIIATGSGGSLAKRLDINGNPTPGVSISAYGLLKETPEINFAFQESFYPGYAWHFPLGNGIANLGICAFRSASGAELRDLAFRFSETVGASSLSSWRGGLGALWSGRGGSWHHEGGVVSCGDAGGLVDPVTGEGITAALVSGIRAGESMARFLRSGRDPAPLGEYSVWVGMHFGDRYRATAIRSLWPGFCGCPA